MYGCVVTAEDWIVPKEPNKKFDKADYYAHPENYESNFIEVENSC